MLRELYIENFALVESLRLPLAAGFTALTGETGAGKSILIDALGALLGGPASAEYIRSGATAAWVEGLFDVAGRTDLEALLDEAGLEPEDGLLLIARKIEAGRSSYYVGGRTSTRTVVRSLGERLVDIHGQHEHQALIHEPSHLDFLDTFAGPTLQPVRLAWEQAWSCFRALQQERERLLAAERDRAQRLDLLSFQVQELEEAQLDLTADEALPAEHRRLAHAERLREIVEEALRNLEGDWGEGQGAAETTAAAQASLHEATRFDESLQPVIAELVTAETILREAARTLQGYASQLDFDPRRLAQAEERLTLLDRLRRKYGESLAEILAYGQRAEAELRDLQNLEDRRAQLDAELEKARAAAGAAAEALSQARQEQARALEAAMVAEMQPLGMEQGQFAVEFEREPDPEGLPAADGKRYAASARGLDQVRFLLSANAGEPLRPLSAVASGGELSRLMLAFKSLCAPATAVPTIVFDEIDVGIGGVTAHAVAEKLASVALQAQVLCVTHLAQIASLADQQVAVNKVVSGERTVIAAETLTGEQRVAELARMMGAREDQETARRHAEEMLARAKKR
ncbi:MAG TPA: DNA repair protein RecN [Armatimonadota bacterium]|jgi:DNA repair protein RecN (Recombination protein N)